MGIFHYSLIAIGLFVGGSVGFFCEYNPNSLRLLVLVLAIFLGISLTIVTLLGDPKRLFLDKSMMRSMGLNVKVFTKIMRRYTVLIYVYFATIAIIFFASLGEVTVIGRIAQGMGALALIWSSSLPYDMCKLQIFRFKNYTLYTAEKRGGGRRA